MTAAGIPLPLTKAGRRRLPSGSGTVVAVLFALLAILNLVPLVWGVLTSLKGNADLFRFPPVLFDFTPTAANYERVFDSGFLSNMGVSALYSVTTVFAVLMLSLPAAYAFDRSSFHCGACYYCS
jgi:multiple sugar transport system permease protein